MPVAETVIADAVEVVLVTVGDGPRFGKARVVEAAVILHPRDRGKLDPADVKRLRELEAENAKLKRMYADLALENTAIKDVLSRKL